MSPRTTLGCFGVALLTLACGHSTSHAPDAGAAAVGGGGKAGVSGAGNSGAAAAGRAGAAGASGSAGSSAALTWYLTCGAPVCRTDAGSGATGAPPCVTQTVKAACTHEGETCDPGSACDENLICATSDPIRRPGGCPISRARYKDDIRYLDDHELRAVSDALLRIPLAHWRYKVDPSTRERLGFIIEDVEPSASAEGDHVDLYGYTSMTVAAVKVQAAQLQALQRELRRLKRRVVELEAGHPRGTGPLKDRNAR